MNNLAFVLYEKGDRAGAIQMMRESLEMNRRELGPGHPDVAGGGTSLAYWLTTAGEYDEAAGLLEEALAHPAHGARRRPSAGREHPGGAGHPARGAQALRGRARGREPRPCGSWSPSCPRITG